MAFVLFAMAAQAQIKMHSNGRITFQTSANTTEAGVTIDSYPSYLTNFNGETFFKKPAFFTMITNGYQGMNMTYTTNPYASTWVVAYPNWTTLTFYVRATGDAYAKHYYTLSNGINVSKREYELITGAKALEVISGLSGYYYSEEELEIPNLESDENVAPDAIEAMYADFEKRSVGLSGNDFVEVFPEGVRTDPQNRLCISYSSVVTMLVEAVKEQQKEIESLRDVLEENGLIEQKKP